MGSWVAIRRLCNVKFFDSKMSFTPNRRGLEVHKNPDHRGRGEKAQLGKYLDFIFILFF